MAAPRADGLSGETRFWIDDMYMITMLQVEAYRATGERKYINHAALEMKAYLDKLQQPNGLFYHRADAPFFWGRGNGWVAAGMAELLRSLPPTIRAVAAFSQVSKDDERAAAVSRQGWNVARIG